MKEIVQKKHPVLRENARILTAEEIGSDKVRKIISEMKTVLDTQKDGIAIAAPQIGEPLRIFVISKSLLKQADKNFRDDGSDMVFINPEIIKISKEKKEMEEGCLSVRWLYGKVKRSVRVTLKALDSEGKPIERGASGLLAQIFQHEVDHLNGILFIDKAKEIWEMTEEEIREMERQNE